MEAPATGHAEFIAPELTTTESLQDRLDRAAEMLSHPHAAFHEHLQQRIGKRSAEKHVHVQFSDASRHRFS